MDCKSEFVYILTHIKECFTRDIADSVWFGFTRYSKKFSDDPECTQLRSLWTSFCLHQGFEVDTGTYDAFMSDMWTALIESTGKRKTRNATDAFYNKMSEYLI